MNALKMCLNWKVLVGLGAVGLAVFIVAPGLIATALPVLLVLACPLSMVVMMVTMGRMGSSNQPTPSGTEAYMCSMHPAVRADQPGNCPTCGMALQPVNRRAVLAPASREEQLAGLQAELRDISDRQVALTREVERLQSEDDDVAATASGHSGPEVPAASHQRS